MNPELRPDDDDEDDHQEPRFILYLAGEAHRAAMRNLADWVHAILLPVYGREVTSAAPWCPRWWTHPEAVARLHGLFMAWHDLTSETYDRVGPSSWHRDHLPATMDTLRDPAGPFAGCKANRHQAKQVPPTTVYLAPAAPTRPGPRTTPEFIDHLADGDYDVELHRVTVWVRDVVLPYYGRETTSSAPWCAQWWHHQEAVSQFHALWMAWDDLTGWDSNLSGPSIWHRDHLGPVLAAVRHPAGPFASCRPNAHRVRTPLPVEEFPG